MVLRLYALLVKRILPENTGPPCNYKIIGGDGLKSPPASPSGETPE